VHIECIPVGSYQTNCYVVFDDDKNCFIVDPGFEGPRIKRYIADNELHVQFIINTHGHIDHIGANHKFDVPVYIHEADSSFLTDPQKNLSVFFDDEYTFSGDVRHLSDNAIIEFAGRELRIIHTPGHTPGCICVCMETMLFSGDTLFRESVGRTDLPYGDAVQLSKSLTVQLLPLPNEMRVLPGHGAETTMAYEKKHNFYLSRIQ